MKVSRLEMTEFATIVANAVVEALQNKQLIGGAGNCSTAVDKPKAEKSAQTEKTAYQKTEQLLYNYNNFKRIIAERMLEIENLRKYGVPQRSTSIVEYSPRGSVQGDTVLPEETVEKAIQNVQASVEGTVQAVALIDKCMAAIKDDPYYKILEMRYIEGRTQEDIAEVFNCSQVTVSKNKSRLIKELSIRLFPNQVISEMMQ